MAEHVLQINKDGRWFVSPQFIPFNLVQVLDINLPAVSSDVRTLQTIISNGNKFMVFARSLDSGGYPTIAFKTENGDNGHKVIRIYKTNRDGSDNFTMRFYCFSNFVAYAPQFGVFVYKNNSIVWCGNCLPLEVKYNDANAQSPGVSCATTYSHARTYSSGIPGWGNTPLVMIANWSAYENGVFAVPINVVDSPPSGSQFPSDSRGYLYIETSVYDAYFRQSLGYG